VRAHIGFGTDGGSRGGKVRGREVVIPLTQKPPLDPQWRDNAFEMLEILLAALARTFDLRPLAGGRDIHLKRGSV